MKIENLEQLKEISYSVEEYKGVIRFCLYEEDFIKVNPDVKHVIFKMFKPWEEGFRKNQSNREDKIIFLLENSYKIFSQTELKDMGNWLFDFQDLPYNLTDTYFDMSGGITFVLKTVDF